MNKENWIQLVENAKQKALHFHTHLKSDIGYKYTVNHDVTKYPAASLYGTWSVAYLQKLLLGNNWNDHSQKQFILESLKKARQKNGLFYPDALDSIKI